MKINRTIKYSVFFVFICLLLQTNISAQDTTLVKRKLNTEFSFYGLWSRCETEHIAGEIAGKAEVAFSGGNTIRFIYDINEKHAVALGLNYYRSTISLGYTLEKEQYNLPFTMDGPLDYKVHAISIPLSYSYSIALSDKLIFSPVLGYYLTFPLISEEVIGGAGYIENRIQRNFLSTNYYTTDFIHGIILELGLRKKLKRNELKFSLISNISTQKFDLGDYTFFPDDQEYTSSGKIKSGLGFIGLNLSYILTHKKIR